MFNIPDPCLETVHNETPFEILQCDKMGVGRRFFDTVVLKGTFNLTPECLGLAATQLPITLADEFWDASNAERSSLKLAGDALWTKPSTDVLVTGSARAPGAQALSSWVASVRVEGRNGLDVTSAARVYGPRWWLHRDGHGWTLSHAEPAHVVPIRYEFAYGGSWRRAAATTPDGSGAPWVTHASNPSGMGFVDEDALDTTSMIPAPQWELPDGPVTKPNHDAPLAGFGPIARPWSSRLQYAGTYDDAWLQRTRDEIAQGMPADYAADFDPRFFQCAHPSLVMPSYLEGRELVHLRGLMPGPDEFTFQLPRALVVATLVDNDRTLHREALPLDTVHIDVDARTVCLSWRLTLDQARGVHTAAFQVTEMT